MADTQKFLNLCGEANTEVDLAARRFSAWLSSVCIPYNGAWGAHTSFVKEAGQATQLANDVLIQAALAFFPGGVGGIVGNAMKALGGGFAMVDGIKDLSKWLLRSGTVVGVTSSSISTGVPAQFKAFPPNPSEWEHSVNMRVQSELAMATECIGIWQHSVNNRDPNFKADFDPAKEISAALYITHPPLDELAAAAVRVEEWKQLVSDASKNLCSQAMATASALAPTACMAGDAAALKDLRPISKPDWQLQFERGFIISWIDNHSASAASHSSNFANSGLASRLDAYGKGIGLPELGSYFVNVANRRMRQEWEDRKKARGGRMSLLDLPFPVMR
jgi:hypothetical protein